MTAADPSDSKIPTVIEILIVGAGPAGLACATTAAERGHDVTLFDAAAEVAVGLAISVVEGYLIGLNIGPIA